MAFSIVFPTGPIGKAGMLTGTEIKKVIIIVDLHKKYESTFPLELIDNYMGI